MRQRLRRRSGGYKSRVSRSWNGAAFFLDREGRACKMKNIYAFK
jgi:hypothetical protein